MQSCSTNTGMQNTGTQNFENELTSNTPKKSIIILTGDHVITNFHSLLISILTLSLLLFILKPSLLLNSTQLLSLSLFNI